LRNGRAPGRDWTGAGVASVRAPKTRTPAGRAPLEGRTTRGVDIVPERSGDLPPMALHCTWTRNRNPVRRSRTTYVWGRHSMSVRRRRRRRRHHRRLTCRSTI